MGRWGEQVGAGGVSQAGTKNNAQTCLLTPCPMPFGGSLPSRPALVLMLHLAVTTGRT